MKKIIMLIIVFALVMQNTKAQEPFKHNLYTANPFLINPAATGYNNALTAFVDAYSQWSSFPEAPRSYSFGINGPISNKTSLGLYVFDDQRNYLNHLNAMIDYSYRVKLNKFSDLTFGLGFGIVHNNVNFNNMNVTDQADPLYLDPSQYNKTQMAAAAGLYYRYKDLQLQFSLPQMLEQGTNFAGQYNLMAMYDFRLNTDFTLKPSALLRAFPGNIMQLDGNAMLDYKKIFWVQLGYRTDQSILASFGLNWEKASLAYCYQANTGPIKVIAACTNEIMLSYTFGDRSSKKSMADASAVSRAIVSGTVTNSLTNEPIVADVVFKDDAGVEVYRTTTGDNGRYSVYLNYGKAYAVEAKATNYGSVNDQLAVGANETSKTYNASLKPTEVMMNLKTEPANANVKVYTELYNGKSDANGNVNVALKPGTIAKTEVSADNYTTKTEKVTVPSDKQDFNQSIKLNALDFPLKGSVKNKETSELVPASVKISDASGKVILKENVNGNIETRLKEGLYNIEVSGQDFITLKETFKLTEATAKDFYLDIKVTPLAKDKSFKLGRVNFATDKSDIKQESLPVLDELVKIMNDNPEIKVAISGHTDNVGNHAKNLKLSQDRVNACMEYAISKGIAKKRLTGRGYGQTVPLVPNNSATNKAINRRVEFKIID